MHRSIVTAVICTLFSGASAYSQLAEDYNPPQANCCLANTARSLADQLQDWNQLGRYHAANEELKARPADPNRVVFLGDSITDFWRLEESFPGKPYVNRGISGQTTQQMLVRMYPDVIDLKPAAVVILAGTNDIARNTGPETAAMVEENLMALTDLARAHGIKVVLCSVTPVSDYTTLTPNDHGGGTVPSGGTQARRIQTARRPLADILKMNLWLKEYASRAGAVYADYYAALVDDKGFLKEGYSNDGLHPNTQGYALMAPVAEAAIRKPAR